MDAKNSISNDEISLLDVYNFFRRRIRALVIIFLVCIGIVLVALFSQPTIFKTTVQLSIGRDLFYLSDNAAANNNLIESSEQIKQRYGGIVRIDAVRNTGIISVTSERLIEAEALSSAIDTANRIVEDHRISREEKAKQFKMFLVATNPNQSELMKVIDAASSSTATKFSNEPSTIILPYKGILTKGLLVGLLASAFISLLGALALDAMAKFKSNHGSAIEA